MSNNKQLPLDELALRETMSDLVFEASREDLVLALGQEAFDSIAHRGRAIVEGAIQTAGLNASPGEDAHV